MSTTKKRIDTINAIVTGSSIANEHECNLVLGEFNEVYRCTKISQKNRKHLLQVLHSTRGLDSALSAFVRINSLHVQVPALGGYLKSLTEHSNPALNSLSQAERSRFQREIVNIRNKYMHEAGSFPNQEQVVTNLLSEMHACLSRVTAL